MAKEDIKIRVPVIPELDKRGLSNLLRDLKNLQQKLDKFDVSWKSIGKVSSLNVRELNKISSAAGQFSKKLSDEFKGSLAKLKDLGDELENAYKKASDLSSEYAGAKGARKTQLSGQIATQMKIVKDLSAAYKKQKDEVSKYTDDLQKLSDASKKQQDIINKSAGDLKKFAAMNPADVVQGFFKKLRGQDFKGAFGQLLQGAAGSRVRGAEAEGGAAGAAKLAQMAKMAQAAEAMSAGAAAIAALVELIMKASKRMADLNKVLTSGIGLAQEMGGSVGTYSKAIKDLRGAALQAQDAMLKYGLHAEDALKAVNAFAKSSGMSLAQVDVQLRDMGKGSLKFGMQQFAINAQVYGKALGMEAQEVAGMMGQFISEVGVNADDVTKTMGDIVKQATQAGMPVQKFMDIFHQAIPNLDLFTNRIEELTGVMKMLSKTMDPRSVQGFMSAMGRGFDQLDFRQRLKMALVIGPGEMGRIMRDDISRAADAVKNGLKGILSPKEIDAALKGPNSIKAMRDLAAKAMARGASGAQVAELNRLGRYSQLQRGGVLKQASGIREMGLMGRLEALQKLAGRFTGGDISGLGEHVAKQLGVSEDEYKAILGMQDSLGDYQSAIEQSGRTSSKSINANLAKLLNLPDPFTDSQNFEQQMKDLQKKNPEKLKQALMTAATMQIEEQQQIAKDAEAKQDSIEDLTAKQIDATQSIGDKMENIIGYLLDKIYFIIDDVFGTLNSLYDALPGWLSGTYSKEIGKAVDQESAIAKKELAGNQEALDYYQKIAAELKAAGARGASTEDLMNSHSDLLLQQLHTMQESAAGSGEYYDKVRNDLAGLFGKKWAANMALEVAKGNVKSQYMFKGSDDFIKALKSGDIETTKTMLSGLDPDAMTTLLARLAKDQAKITKFSAGRGKAAERETEVEKRAKQKQEKMAALQSDHDKRAAELMGKIAENTDKIDKSIPFAAAATGQPTVAGGVTSPQVKDASEAQQTQADNTEQTVKNQQDQIAQADQQYEAATDTLSLLKKGIRFEQSWMTTKFKNVLKEASLDALRPALLEQLVGYAKILDDSEFRKAVAENAWNIAQRGADAMNALLLSKEGSGHLSNLMGYKIGGEKEYATGVTSVPHDMIAQLHAGEQVISKANAGRGGGKIVNVTIYAQGVPASQIAHHISNIQRSD